MKKIIAITFLLLISGLVGQGVYHARKGLSLRRLQGVEQTVSSNQIDPKIQKILSQPFSYLGRGRQCFAFASVDGKYVLKFPRTDIYRLPFWMRAFAPTSYKKKSLHEKQTRKDFIFESINLAKTELSEITGILFTHLKASKPKKETLTLIDALGFEHKLPIHTSLFILQEKHPLWTQSFIQAKEKTEKARILNALVDAILIRAKKGILNRDRSFLKNYGFDGQKAYQIDVGSFFQTDALDLHQAYRKSAHDSLEPVFDWLSKTDPEMLEILNKRLSEI